MATHCLHIGINDYAGPGHDLAGCVNDARDMARLFGQRHRGAVRDALDASPFFGAAASQCVLLNRQATRERVLIELWALVRQLARGDLGVVTFSGHGTYVPDARGGDESDGCDEALVCHGLDLVLDDELAEVIERRATGARMLVIIDACHAGTGHRSLGPRLSAARDDGHRYRFLPPAELPREKLRPPRVIKRPPKMVDVNYFAACRDDQLAADSNFDGRPRGAYTHYLLAALAGLRPGATYKQWRDAVAALLPNRDFDQEPQTAAYARSLNWKIPTR